MILLHWTVFQHDKDALLGETSNIFNMRLAIARFHQIREMYLNSSKSNPNTNYQQQFKIEENNKSFERTKCPGSTSL